MRKYRLRFSLAGFIAFLLVMLPNIFWMLAPPAHDVLSANGAAHPLLEILLQASRWCMIGLLVFIVNPAAGRPALKSPPFLSAAACLAAYYLLWLLYYVGFVNSWLLSGMALFPSLFFVLVAIGLKNYPGLVAAASFGILHTTITCSPYLF